MIDAVLARRLATVVVGVRPLRACLVWLLLCLSSGLVLGADLQTFDNVRLIPTAWADGDSFRVVFTTGEEHTVRLYGADCIEYHVTDRTDARRLRGVVPLTPNPFQTEPGPPVTRSRFQTGPTNHARHEERG